MLVRYERVEKQKIETRPQARQPDGPTDGPLLAESLLQGELQFGGVMAGYTMIWGRRRDTAMSVKAITHL